MITLLQMVEPYSDQSLNGKITFSKHSYAMLYIFKLYSFLCKFRGLISSIKSDELNYLNH